MSEQNVFLEYDVKDDIKRIADSLEALVNALEYFKNYGLDVDTGGI
jgi:hypothetical protein